MDYAVDYAKLSVSDIPMLEDHLNLLMSTMLADVRSCVASALVEQDVGQLLRWLKWYRKHCGSVGLLEHYGRSEDEGGAPALQKDSERNVSGELCAADTEMIVGSRALLTLLVRFRAVTP